MNKQKFSYNPDTFTYETVLPDRRLLARRLSVAFLIGMLLAGIFVGVSFFRGRHFEDGIVQARLVDQELLLQQQGSQFTKMQHVLAKLHHNDNNFYRSILNLDPIDPSLWNGGTGGTEKYRALASEGLRHTTLLMDKLTYQLALQQNSFAKLEEVAELKSEELKHIPVMRPVPGRVLSGFGLRADPMHPGGGQFHSGLDMHAAYGGIIQATGSGTVITAGVTESGYGIQVEVDHGFGFITKYAHLSRLNVRVGQVLKRGDVVGFAGRTGWATGTHLHYEVIRLGVKVNPADYYYN